MNEGDAQHPIIARPWGIMPPMRKTLLLSLLLVAGTMPASADQAPRNPRNPYARLFDVQEALKKAVQEKPASFTAAPRSKVVCGMTVVEVTPALDPKMGVTPPKDEKTRFTIRAIDPPVCHNR